MKFNFTEYKDKVRACWLGKSIGGTMGVPYEGQRDYLDIKGFVTDKNVTYPNDDLDLQLVWLHTMETLPPSEVDCQVLGEMWQSYITPHWNEYGIGKNNMKRGILPPLSGDYDNTWKHSNGAWIRTEIWATLFPGSPALACKYAIEDARVDHGSGEGTAAAAFVAALESLAFIEKDVRNIIELALEYVPAESRMAKSVVHTLECFDKGMSAKDARNSIQQFNADIGDGWFEAPSNVCYVLLGMLWGGGDFKKSMIATINCGDDTDCTGATLGSILGIMGGTSVIPKDWSEHIGDNIVTCSLALGVFYNYFVAIPTTVTQLTERVVTLAPRLQATLDSGVGFTDGESEIDREALKNAATEVTDSLNSLIPNSYEVSSHALCATVIVNGEPEIKALGERRVTIKLENRLHKAYGNIPYVLNLRWILPDGFTVSGSPKSVAIHQGNAHYERYVTIDVTFKAPESIEAENRIVLEAVAEGRSTSLYVPIVLVG